MILQGNPLDYIIVFWGGVLISFTPCTYPLVPVILGYIGVISAGSRLKGFSLSICYVTGLAITYSVLGLIAALGGKLFGQISAHPATNAISGIIFIIFGLALTGSFNIPLPKIALQNKIKRKGFVSVFLLGLTSGLVVGPCTAPALGAVLVYIGSRQNIFYGITLMLTFAYGLGVIFILAGTFSGILMNISKIGPWSAKIKKVCGIILILAGVYFLLKAGGLIL